MTHRRDRPLGPWVWPAVFFLLGAVAIFVLPWHFPFPKPMESSSYVFGYNNSVALLGLAGLLGLILLWRLFGRREAGFPDFLVSEPRGSWGLRLSVLVAVAVSSGIIWLWWVFLPFAYFGESGYFLTRLDAMFLGWHPYRDFDFGYGPSMLYLPFALHRLTGVALDTAHILNVLVFTLTGFLVLYRILCRLKQPSSWRIGLVIAMGVLGINFSLAPIYTPLRFLWALFVILEVEGAVASSPRLRLREMVMTGVYCLAGFLISPDIGLVTLVGLLTYIGWSAACRRISDAVLLPFPLLALGVVLEVSGPEHFKYVFAFGGGYMNLPVPPAPYILVLGLAACWTLPLLALRSLRAPASERPVAAALTMVLGLMLPAALGRCDPGHVLWNGLPLFLVSAALVCSQPSPWRRAVFPCATLIMVATVLASSSHYKEWFEAVRNRRAFLQVSFQRKISVESIATTGGNYRRFPWSKSMQFTSEAEKLLKYPRIATPLGCSEDWDKFFKLTGRHVMDFSFGGTASEQDLKRKLQGLQHERVVMIPVSAIAKLIPMNEEGILPTQDFLTRLFVFPVRWNLRNQPFSFNNVVAYVIVSQYRKVDEISEYVIMEQVGENR